MPRPKDYTLATSAASDDFLLIDGTTNGTRKLSAFSPTFGGNLTVSGGSVSLNALTGNPPQFRHHPVGTADIIAGVNGIRFLNNAASGAGMSLDANNDTTFTGNLTVSGTGTSAFSGAIKARSGGADEVGFGPYGTGTGGIYFGNGTVSLFNDANTQLKSLVGLSLAGNLTVSGTASSFGGFINAGGAVYVRKDSGEVFRADAAGAGYRIVADQNGVLLGGATTTVGGNLTVSGGTITSGTGTLTLNSSANTVVLQSAGTTALTLDSSQYATFAGGVTVNGGSGLVVQPGSGNTNGTVCIRPSGTAVTSSLNFQNAAGNATQASLTALATTLYFDSATHILRTNGTTALTLDSSQNATFEKNINAGGASNDADIRLHLTAAGDTSAKYAALWRNASYNKIFHLRADGDLYTSAGATITGAIAIGNTVQTAASVASTHKVTISIGGTTYYLLATNV